MSSGKCKLEPRRQGPPVPRDGGDGGHWRWQHRVGRSRAAAKDATGAAAGARAGSLLPQTTQDFHVRVFPREKWKRVFVRKPHVSPPSSGVHDRPTWRNPGALLPEDGPSAVGRRVERHPAPRKGLFTGKPGVGLQDSPCRAGRVHEPVPVCAVLEAAGVETGTQSGGAGVGGPHEGVWLPSLLWPGTQPQQLSTRSGLNVPD